MTEPVRPDAVLAYYLAQQPFVARRWLADRVDAWLADPLCRHVLITADAGMGKSSFVAWLTTRYPLTPCYFIRLDSLTPFGSADATHLLMSLGHQLAAACPEAMATQPLRIEVDQRTGRVEAGGAAVGVRATRLVANPFRRTEIAVRQRSGRVGGAAVGVEVDELVDSEWLLDIATLQRLALLDPAAELARRQPSARIVLMIDGLDELRHQPASPRWTILDWLANCPVLPGNVRIVATSRPDPSLLRPYRLRQGSRLRELAVAAADAEVRSDLASFADGLAADRSLRDALVGHADLAALAEAAAVRADGNFLYLTSWARALRYAVRTGWWDRSLLDGTALPSGLASLYELFVTMLWSAAGSSWEAVHRPVLAVLAVARGPLAARQVALLAGVAERPAVLALADMPHFLRVTGDRYAIFHATFAEYLRSEDARAAAPELWTDPVTTEREVARRLIDAYGASWASCTDEYAVTEVVSHLVAGLPDGWCASALTGVLADPGFLAVKVRVAGMSRTLVDFAVAYEALGEAGAAVVSALAGHALRGDVDADSAYAVLSYRPEFDRCYGALLAAMAEADETAPPWADFAELLVHRLRGRGRFDEAAALLDRIATVRGERSRTLYERGYLHFVHGRVDESLAALTASVEAAELAGNDVGAWMSRLVRDQIACFADRIDHAAYAATLDAALAFFAARSGNPHADRWLMNVHNQKLTLAYLRGDESAAARERDVLLADEWTRRERQPFADVWTARAAIAAQDWPTAVAAYERLLGPDALTAEPPVTEGIAWNLLDYGRALAGVGRPAEARQAWRQTLRCSDATAAWPWKPRAAALLDGS